MSYEPMLAHPMPEDFNPAPGTWVAEEKYDGHRLMVKVTDSCPWICATSRGGLRRELPAHLIEELKRLPVGVYDGELFVPGKRSYGVTEKLNQDELVYVVFDLLEVLGHAITSRPYSERRSFLVEIFRHDRGPVCLAKTTTIFLGRPEIAVLAREVWSLDGEGLILKRLAAPYQPGKRSKDQLKVKQERTAVLTVVGFAKGKSGPHSVVLLVDDEGNETRVKAKDDATRAMFESFGPDIFMGRKLRIDYQERTPDGGYRHPMFDRFEEDKGSTVFENPPKEK